MCSKNPWSIASVWWELQMNPSIRNVTKDMETAAKSWWWLPSACSRYGNCSKVVKWWVVVIFFLQNTCSRSPSVVRRGLRKHQRGEEWHHENCSCNGIPSLHHDMPLDELSGGGTDMILTEPVLLCWSSTHSNTTWRINRRVLPFPFSPVLNSLQLLLFWDQPDLAADATTGRFGRKGNRRWTASMCVCNGKAFALRLLLSFPSPEWSWLHGNPLDL